jgi:hypothetical protein
MPVVGIVGRRILCGRQLVAIGSGKRPEVVVERVIFLHDDDDVIDQTSEIGFDAHDRPRVTSSRRMPVCVCNQVITQKPDFSGEWKLNVQASTLSPIVAPVAQSGVLLIEHHEPRFAAHQAIVLDGKPFESKFDLLSDGREVVTDGGGRRIASTLRWDGDALVAAWRIHGPDGEMTISFRYELQDGGRRLRAAEQLRGGGRDQDNLWVFERP